MFQKTQFIKKEKSIFWHYLIEFTYFWLKKYIFHLSKQKLHPSESSFTIKMKNYFDKYLFQCMFINDYIFSFCHWPCPGEASFQSKLKANNALGNFHINAEIIYTEKSKTFSMDKKVFRKMFKRWIVFSIIVLKH